MPARRSWEELRSRNLTRVPSFPASDGFGQSMRTQCLRVAQGMEHTVAADEQYGPRDVRHDAAAPPHPQRAGRAGRGSSATEFVPSTTRTAARLPLNQ